MWTMMPRSTNDQPDWFAAAARVSAWSFGAITLLLAGRLALHMQWWEWPMLIIATPFAWALADVLTGVVHWALDTYGDPETPFIGPNFIEPFRRHHREPEAMLAISGAENIGSAAMLALAPLLALVGASFTAVPTRMIAAAAICLTATVLTNLFHRWAHMEAPPWIARSLQRLGMALPRSEHTRHHQAPYDSAYCITCGWMNGVLEDLGFFERLEAALASVGVHPHATSRCSSASESRA